MILTVQKRPIYLTWLIPVKRLPILHAFGTNNFFYFDHANSQDFTNSKVTANFNTGTSWFSSRNIPISKYLVPHYYEMGTNVFSGLQTWGTSLIGTMMDPGEPEATAPWMMVVPFRLYESGAAYDRVDNVYYADYMTIPGHPELNNKFFNCATEIRDITGYEWLGEGRNNVTDGTADGIEWLRRPLDSMMLATLFSHEYTFIDTMSMTGWRQMMQGIATNIAGYQPIYVSLDYGCAYARAVKDSNITSGTYNWAGNLATVNLSGTTDMPTKFYVFTENSGQIVDKMVDVPTFAGTTQVVFTPTVEPDITAPELTVASPVSNATGINIYDNVSATFNEGLDPASVGTGTFELRNPSAALVPATVSYSVLENKALTKSHSTIGLFHEVYCFS